MCIGLITEDGGDFVKVKPICRQRGDQKLPPDNRRQKNLPLFGPCTCHPENKHLTEYLLKKLMINIRQILQSGRGS